MSLKHMYIHPEDIEKGNTGVDGYTLSKPHALRVLIKSFPWNDRNYCVIYGGAVPGPDGVSMHNISPKILQNYIKGLLISNKDLDIFFDDSCEGILFYRLVEQIHAAIGNFEDTGINGKHIHYVSCTLNAEALYKKYCLDNNISNPIQMYIVNSWEFSIYNSSIQRHNVIKEKEKTFLCFNRILRPHRGALLASLLKKDLVKNSYYSFFLVDYGGEVTLEKAIDILRVSSFSKDLNDTISTELSKIKDKLPLKINIDSGHNNKNYLDNDDIKYFDNSYLSLVTETNYLPLRNNSPDTIFFSEKIFKPIKLKHPFILVSCRHSLKYLKKLGYKTFHPYINEEYDEIENHEERLQCIVNEIERLNNFTTEQWIEWQNNINHIVIHNQIILQIRKNYEFTDS
jgi:hypothetical protein